MPRKPAVIAYDITCDKRRRQAARCLKQWRLDGQYSLTETTLTQREAEELFLQLADIIDTDRDCLLLAWIDQGRASRPITRCAGIGFRAPALYLD
jgi:CRISPR-associated protein Cas2